MIACCRLRVPAVAVYLVWPALIASKAASLIFCGVSKSGSPAPRSTTSTPAARIASAACMAASVDDGFILATFSETGNGEVSGLVIISDFNSDLHFKRKLRCGDLLSHPLFHQSRHETCNRRAKAEHFFDQTRAHIRILFGGHHEHSLDARL